MKVVCLSVCFIGFLLVGDVFSWNNYYDDDPVFEIDSHDTEEEPVEDYPIYYFRVDGEEGGIKTEENEVETVDKRPKPDWNIGDEDDSGTGTPDLGPLPDTEAVSMDLLVETVAKLISDLKAQQGKITELEEANKRLILKIDSIEQQTKTNSIIVTNVRQDANESAKMTLQRILHVFNKVMRVRTSAGDIAVALRAETNTSSGNKPIVIRFTNFATKMRVLAARNRLSHTDMTVSSDYSELVAQRRTALVPYLQQARSEGSRAFILYDKLVVDGVLHTLEELKSQKESNEQADMLAFDR